MCIVTVTSVEDQPLSHSAWIFLLFFFSVKLNLQCKTSASFVLSMYLNTCTHNLEVVSFTVDFGAKSKTQ